MLEDNNFDMWKLFGRWTEYIQKKKKKKRKRRRIYIYI